MAFTHINFDSTGRHAALLRNWLTSIDAILDSGAKLMSLIPTMIDGNGSDAAHFTEVASRFGFGSTADAKAAWEEIQSAYSKVSGDGSVSSVNAALKQVAAKLR